MSVDTIGIMLAHLLRSSALVYVSIGLLLRHSPHGVCDPRPDLRVAAALREADPGPWVPPDGTAGARLLSLICTAVGLQCLKPLLAIRKGRSVRVTPAHGPCVDTCLSAEGSRFAVANTSHQ